ncbi:MAG: hypothetical protein GEU80_09585 [Dehalococcoidia bacterium]|nr:hypothetical protein [Dehalococcoidia bacterium]
MLYHFSDDPTIEVFEPRTPAHRPEVQPLVWAIDEWHAPAYFFPRDCPRILVWQVPSTTPEDRERWFDHTDARMIAYLEWDWLERMRSTALYRYTFADEPFESVEGDGWMYVSRETLTPLSVEPVGDLLEALRAAEVEVRLVERLTPLRGAWDTSLHVSGIRLRNAQDWEGPASSPPPANIAR